MTARPVRIRIQLDNEDGSQLEIRRMIGKEELSKFRSGQRSLINLYLTEMLDHLEGMELFK